MTRIRAPRRVVVVDNRDLARSIGQRIRNVRQSAKLTQRELAGDRYTPGYISALESGGAKPSMAALRYIADRLHVDIRSLVASEAGQWQRWEADLRLAAGDWQAAADLYQAILDRRPEPRQRAAAQLGLAEALCRLDRGREALTMAAEAQALFEQAKQPREAALAAYWLSAAHSQAENEVEARSLLLQILADIRGGLPITSDFKARVLIALAIAEGQDGEHQRALTYLNETRGLIGELDDLRRARFYYNLAVEYQQTGDFEGALTAGAQSAALFAATESQREFAMAENAMALTYLEVGNVDAAAAALAKAQSLVGAGADDRLAPYFAETEAQLLLARGDLDAALAAATHATLLAQQAGNERTVAAAQLTLARILRRQERLDDALAAYQTAADTARGRGARAIARTAIGEWADLLSELGRHEEANVLFRDALKL